MGKNINNNSNQINNLFKNLANIKYNKVQI